jgi:hypothetical protein
MSDRGFVSEGSSWVGALAVGQEENWAICVDKGLWGSGSSAAGGVRRGDEFFLWQSGAGWRARCVVTTDARQPTSVDPAPWDDGRDYKWIFGIRVIRELGVPFQPGSTNNRQNITDLPNIRLGQFPRLSRAESAAVRSFFGLMNPPKDRIIELIEIGNDQHEAEILQRTVVGPVEIEQLVKARRGQGVFRSNVSAIEKECRVTGLRAVEHLKASHIKPWRRSDDLEKIDGNNGLMLSPHVDHLFDRGWIRFSEDGVLVPSPLLEDQVLVAWRIEPSVKPRPFNDRQCEYLAYHREFIFQNAEH